MTITRFAGGAPFVESGFGLSCNKYCSGRAMAMVGEHGGLLEVRFCGQQHLGGARFFLGEANSAFNKLFRLQLLLDGEAYYPEFQNTSHFPFGYRSECEMAGVRLRHELILLETTLVHRVTILENPRGVTVSARVLHHGYTLQAAPERIRSEFLPSPDGQTLQAIIDDPQVRNVPQTPRAITGIEIGCTQPATIVNTHDGFKFYLTAAALSGSPGESLSFFLHFTSLCTNRPGDDNRQSMASYQPMLQTESSKLRPRLAEQCEQRIQRYDAIMKEQTAIITDNPYLNAALANVLPLVRTLQVQGTPGAIRASQDYWVWGWDSLVHADALLYAGGSDIVQQMLRFYRDYADPEQGVLHAFRHTFEPHYYMAFSAQCLYVTVLYNYFCATGDLDTVREAFPFAQSILEHAAKAVQADTGLSAGVGFYPDFPGMIGQLQEGVADLSIINNSLYYQALRAASVLASKLDDTTFAACCSTRAAATRRGLEQILFDSDAGYWIDSAAADTLAPRRHYPLYAMFWVTPFAGEPGATQFPRIRSFMKENFPFRDGMYMFPPKSPAFMADGNQLGAYYPGVDRGYWNLANRAADATEAERLRTIITRFWSEHTYPEGLTHETVNADPTLDNPGCKQAFSAKAWYCDTLELLLGLSTDSCGITLNPLPDAGPIFVSGLRLRDHRLTIVTRGKGTSFQLHLNGAPIAGVNKIRWDQLRSENLVELIRCENEPSLRVTHADELNIEVLQAEPSTLKLRVSGEGFLWFASSHNPTVMMDGKPVPCVYAPEYQTAIVAISGSDLGVDLS